jgi:hypothetical protein
MWAKLSPLVGPEMISVYKQMCLGDMFYNVTQNERGLKINFFMSRFEIDKKELQELGM